MNNRSSGTAEGVAYIRFYESSRPEEQKICNDDMAYDLSARWVKLASIICRLIPRKLMDMAFEKKGKGVTGFLAVRTRLFDDYVQECIENGARQYVILGAGLDSRAYRFAEKLSKIKVFEIDHPLSQAVKKKRIIKLIGKLPPNVNYIPVDFTKDDLSTCLLNAGYDPAFKTVFTFEGVSMYLDEKSVRETLSFVLSNSGQGSSVMFDYIFKEVLDGRMNSRVVTHMNNLKHVFNEPVLFGIESGMAESFISSIGFCSAKDFTPQMLHEMYIKPVVPERAISDFYAIASAYK